MKELLTNKEPNQKEMKIIKSVSSRLIRGEFDAVEFTLRNDDNSEEYQQVSSYIKENAESKEKNLYIMRTKSDHDRFVLKTNGYIKIVDYLYDVDGDYRRERELVYYLRKSTAFILPKNRNKEEKKEEDNMLEDENKEEKIISRMTRVKRRKENDNKNVIKGEFLQNKRGVGFLNYIKNSLKDSFQKR